MTRSRGRKPRRVIVDVARTPGRATAAIEFHAPSILVTVELGPGDTSAGPIAGVEGVGSELFFDSTGRLGALELSPPLTNLRVSPAAKLRSATAGAWPGELLARELPTGSLGGVGAAFTRPFGAALFVFEEPRTADGDLVELADGIVARVAQETGALQSIWVAGFNGRQRVLGDPVSIERDGAAFIESLNAIHLEFLTGPAATFVNRARPIAAAARDLRLERLVEVYARIKSVDAALEAAKRSRD